MRPRTHFGRFVTALALGLVLATAAAAACLARATTIPAQDVVKVVNTRHRVVLDGGGLVTLSGGGKRQILYMNTCDPRQVLTTSDCFNQPWPQL